MVRDDLVQYKALSRLSILDYYTYLEIDNKNKPKIFKKNE